MQINRLYTDILNNQLYYITESLVQYIFRFELKHL